MWLAFVLLFAIRLNSISDRFANQKKTTWWINDKAIISDNSLSWCCFCDSFVKLCSTWGFLIILNGMFSAWIVWKQLIAAFNADNAQRIHKKQKVKKMRELLVPPPFINLVCRKHIHILCMLFCVFFCFMFKKYALFLSRSFDGTRRRSVHSMARDKCIQ